MVTSGRFWVSEVEGSDGLSRSSSLPYVIGLPFNRVIVITI